MSNDAHVLYYSSPLVNPMLPSRRGEEIITLTYQFFFSFSEIYEDHFFREKTNSFPMTFDQRPRETSPKSAIVFYYSSPSVNSVIQSRRSGGIRTTTYPSFSRSKWTLLLRENQFFSTLFDQRPCSTSLESAIVLVYYSSPSVSPVFL